MERDTMTIDEAGQRLGLHRNTAYALAKRGEIPVIRLGRRLLVPRGRFDEMLAGQEMTRDATGTARV